MNKKIIFTLLAVLLGYFGYLAYQFSDFMEESGECGMSVGPIYGESIKLDQEDLDLEQQIDIPVGKLGLMNISDTLAPKLIRFDDNDEIIWAIEFREDPKIDIPYRQLSEMKLIQDEYGIRLSFFNRSHLEPGKIYLTDNYDVKYMCLSLM